MGCSPNFESKQTESLPSTAQEPPSTEQTNPTVDPTTGICTQLDFTGVAWPTSLTPKQQTAMALSLNVTGSFEGRAGWSNLAGNFDGQGMSLGLNQQNLGQGTLQPLLNQMFADHPEIMTSLFSTPNRTSLSKMLSAWSKATPLTMLETEDLFSNQDALNDLDEGSEITVNIAGTSANAASVEWAKQALFQADGKTFQTSWKNSFLSLAVTSPYRTLQIGAALKMFKRALAYFDQFRFQELRSLLLMYDFVVQNGGFNTSHLDSFRNFDRANPRADETARAKALIEIRVASVRPQYKDDVRARKTTIVDGVGKVHGSNRNLPKQYCFNPADSALGFE